MLVPYREFLSPVMTYMFYLNSRRWLVLMLGFHTLSCVLVQVSGVGGVTREAAP
jgi:hypothetical protein